MLSRPLQPYTRKRAPQNRWLQQFRGLPYVLEGNIGSGKTTLGRQLVLFCEARGLAASFLEEQFPKDLLQQFIRHGKEHPGERNPYAAPFQMQVLECRAATYREADALCARGHVVFIDRSLPGDVVFAALNKALGHFTTEEWRAYEVRVHECDLLEPAALIYLATSVTECLARIAMRRREGEDAYTAEYLQGIEDMYQRVLGEVDYPLAVVDWDTRHDFGDLLARDAVATRLFETLRGILWRDYDGFCAVMHE